MEFLSFCQHEGDGLHPFFPRLRSSRGLQPPGESAGVCAGERLTESPWFFVSGKFPEKIRAE
jgi:hypothetical protein